MFNTRSVVGQAIESILCQTFSDFQFLIINDGSTDGSEEIARSYRDPRILILDQANSGPGVAMNRALRYASDMKIPYIARMDSDDVSHPNRFGKQYNLLQSKEHAAACSSNCYYVDSNSGEIIGTSTVSRSSWLINWEIFHGLRGLVQGATMFRTEALAEIGGYRTIFMLAEETDLFLRLAERYDMVNCTEFLYKIRLRSESISLRNINLNLLYQFYALKCAECRRQGKTEISFDKFTKSPGKMKRYEMWREERLLKAWRDNLGRNSLSSIILASIIDPRRALVRILRQVDKGAHLFNSPIGLS